MTSRAKHAAYMREWRRKRRELAVVEPPDPVIEPDDIAESLRHWSHKNLLVPHGHESAGNPLVIPEFGIKFIADAMRTRESLLCVARKNAKSAIIAVYLLARLVGPIALKGYRAGVCSVNRDKAAELFAQCKAIGEMSKLQGLQFKVSPFRIVGPQGMVDVLSADRSAGHASGFDDAIFDELGLLPERKRDLVNGLRSSVSARNGRFMALSILGDSPFTREMLERQHLETTSVHLYRSKDNCPIDDEEAWYEANPGLGSVKSIQYMRDEAARCLSSPADEKSFRAFDLNQPLHPEREMICSVNEYINMCEEEPPYRGERCFIGIDIGGANSMSAAIVVYPDTCRVDTYAAFAGTPDLIARGRTDGVGDLYERMANRGEIVVFQNHRVTPVNEFLEHVLDDVSADVIAIGADRYRQSEVVQALETIGRFPNVIWRGTGASATADGTHDVRAFQRAIKKGTYKMKRSLAWISAITESSIRYDGAGNPALDKRSSKSRIDVLQAAVIAFGIADTFARVDTDSFALRLV